jgi:hypothetical protein
MGGRAQRSGPAPARPDLRTLSLAGRRPCWPRWPRRWQAPPLQLDPRVIRVPIVPGSDPRLCYGDL